MNRLRELDGLRGLAALIVLFYHISLTYPSLAAPYYAQPVEGPLAFALTYTPLHLLRDGRMAVYIFFVLSGLVLALPVLARGRAYPCTRNASSACTFRCGPRSLLASL